MLVISLLMPTLGAAQAPTAPLVVPPGPAAPAPVGPSLPAPGVTVPSVGVPGQPIVVTPFVNRVVAGPDYRLGPGDLLEVQIAGRLEVARQQGEYEFGPQGSLSEVLDLTGGLFVLFGGRLPATTGN
jgi:protein involved in polysaccharide export with SLBB domain